MQLTWCKSQGSNLFHIKLMANYHLIINEHEKYAIVNALAYYDLMHAHMDKDVKKQWTLCRKEDLADLGSDNGIDKLATRVANI